MIKPSDLCDYPVIVSDEDFKSYTGYDLLQDIENAQERNTLSEFIDTVHMLIYDCLIYACGSKRIKNRIIERYRDDLEKPLKRALLAQGISLIENGDISEWNGATLLAGGQADVKDSALIRQKIVCPKAIRILQSTSPDILYFGG